MKTMKKIVAILAVALMLCSILPLSVFAAAGDEFELVTDIADLQIGDQIIIFAVNDNAVLSTTQNGNNRGKVDATPNGTVITATDAMQVITVEAGLTEGTYAFNVGNGYLFAASSSKNYLRTETTLTANSSWSIAIDASGVATIKATGSNTRNWMRYNKSSSIFACYGSGQNDIAIYKLSGGEEPPVSCEHDWVTEQTKAPDCTNAGENTLTCSKCGESKTETVDALGHSYGEATETVAPDCTNAGEQQSTCSVCGDVKTETVKALGHNYVDGTCSVCGEAQPLEVTIETFANTGVLDGTASISWTNGGFQFTSYKAGSTTAIRTSDADHFRIYAHNKVVVSGLNGELLTKVQFNATSASYATVLGDCAAEGWVASVDGTVVTFTATAANGAESLTIEDVSAQTRVSSVIITPYVASESDCEHDYVGVETQAPSCTVEGVTTYTCSKCGESYTEAIAVIPHDYAESIVDSTCTATGTATYTCSVCFDSYDEVIPVKPHNYVNDICDVCGAVKAYKGTITFDADKTQRTEYSASVQKWENEGLTFINNKADSTTNVGDYGAPGRFYKNSQIIISFPEMSKLIIDASGIGSSYLWEASLDAAGLTYTVSDQIYTITFAEPVNSLELTAANQVRANSITAVVAHEHVYDNDFDTDCNKCGEVRAVVAPIAKNGFSVSEDVSGLAVRFTATLEGMGIDDTTAIYDNAMLNGYKVISMGAIVTNGVSTTNVPAVYLCDDDVSTGAQYAIRIKNIPADKYDVEITFTPYIIVEIDGEQVTIEGEAVTGTYNQYAG
ncbi:MAG: hypothetical protein IJB36_01410 [Clostridia bacterium]|nr:hypothetical protein [Clostridia bacterium]